MDITYTESNQIPIEKIVSLYHANQWPVAKKQEQLYNALINSHSLITAWDGELLVGLGNAISDGYLIVYYPHLLILPQYQRKGIGTEIMKRLTNRYQTFNQQILTADRGVVNFYKKCGFKQIGPSETMWIYRGH